MKIKTRLKITTTITLCLTGFMVLALVWSSQEFSRVDQNLELVESLQRLQSERVILRDDIVLRQDRRSWDLWLAKSGELGRLLQSAGQRFSDSEDRAVIKEAQDDLKATLLAFTNLWERREADKAGARKDLQLNEAESIIFGQVILKAHALGNDIERLHRSVNSVKETARRGMVLTIVIFAISSVVAIFVNTTMISRIMTRGIKELSAGTRIIAGGNLGHRIDVTGDDEFAELARASNDMAEKLGRSYTSVENLQKEVSERRQVEAGFRALSSRQEAILAAVPEIITEVDINKVYTWLNPAGVEFFGDDVLGKEAACYFEGAQDIYAAVQPLFDGAPTVLYVESWQRRRDGEKRLLAWWCRVLKDADGNVTGALSTARDITERKQAQEALRQLNAELEQRVVERTAELESANKELEAFSYTVSHDLRAPLRHLIGFVELLNKRKGDGLDEKTLHYLTVISESATQMSHLVDDLLSFSRMGRAEMLRARVELDRLIRDVLQTLQPEIKGRNIVWKIAPLPQVQGDSAMLQLVVTNLLSNALKFTRLRPKAEIEVGYYEDEKEGYIFFVRDNGAGFDAKYTDKLFNLFQRLHRTEEFEGTGVGLANVRRIIQRHGGRTWAEGAVGSGATVYFSLPKG